MDYRKAYYESVRQLLDRTPKRSDGISSAQIATQERKLGIALPEAVRDYYQIAGKLDQLNKSHNRLLDLDQLVIDGDYVIFMEENQWVVHWGFRRSDPKPDPEVWQRVNSDKPEWYSEDAPFSQFIARNHRRQAGLVEE